MSGSSASPLFSLRPNAEDSLKKPRKAVLRNGATSSDGMLHYKPRGFGAVPSSDTFMGPAEPCDQFPQRLRVLAMHGFHAGVILIIEHTRRRELTANGQVAMPQCQQCGTKGLQNMGGVYGRQDLLQRVGDEDKGGTYRPLPREISFYPRRTSKITKPPLTSAG